MTWKPIGVTVPVGPKEAAMIIDTMNGVLYYLVIPMKEPKSAPIPVPTPVTEPVLKPIALDILRDMTSGLALDPIQQMIYSIRIEHALAAVGLTAVGVGGAVLAANVDKLRLATITAVIAPIGAVMCVGF